MPNRNPISYVVIYDAHAHAVIDTIILVKHNPIPHHLWALMVEGTTTVPGLPNINAERLTRHVVATCLVFENEKWLSPTGEITCLPQFPKHWERAFYMQFGMTLSLKDLLGSSTFKKLVHKPTIADSPSDRVVFEYKCLIEADVISFLKSVLPHPTRLLIISTDPDHRRPLCGIVFALGKKTIMFITPSQLSCWDPNWIHWGSSSIYKPEAAFILCARSSALVRMHAIDTRNTVLMTKLFSIKDCGTKAHVEIALPITGKGSCIFDGGQEGVVQELALRKHQWCDLWVLSKLCRCMFQGHAPVVLARFPEPANSPVTTPKQPYEGPFLSELVNHPGWTLKYPPPKNTIMGRLVPIPKSAFIGYTSQSDAPKIQLRVPTRYARRYQPEKNEFQKRHRTKPKKLPLHHLTTYEMILDFEDAIKMHFQCDHGCHHAGFEGQIPPMPMATFIKNHEHERTVFASWQVTDVHGKINAGSSVHLMNPQGHWGPFHGPHLTRYWTMASDQRTQTMTVSHILSAGLRRENILHRHYRYLQSLYGLSDNQPKLLITDDSLLKCSDSQDEEGIRTKLVIAHDSTKVRILYKSADDKVEINRLLPQITIDTARAAAAAVCSAPAAAAAAAAAPAGNGENSPVDAKTDPTSTTESLVKGMKTKDWTIGWKACKLLTEARPSFFSWEHYLMGIDNILNQRGIRNLVFQYYGSAPVAQNGTLANASTHWLCPRGHQMNQDQSKTGEITTACTLCKRPADEQHSNPLWLHCHACPDVGFHVCHACVWKQRELEEVKQQTTIRSLVIGDAAEADATPHLHKDEKNELTVQFPSLMPYTGDSWCIVKLAIPPNSRINMASTGAYIGSRRKCRVDRAIVIDIQAPVLDREESLISKGWFDAVTAIYKQAKTIYTYGEYAYPDGFDVGTAQCAQGIHYYEEDNRQSAFAQWIPGYDHLPDLTNYVPSYSEEQNTSFDAADASTQNRSIAAEKKTPMEAAGAGGGK